MDHTTHSRQRLDHDLFGRSFQFLAGIYYSTVKKPNMYSFLKQFSLALKDLFTKGFDWFNKNTNAMEHSIAIAPVATLDAPARAAALNINAV